MALSYTDCLGQLVIYYTYPLLAFSRRNFFTTLKLAVAHPGDLTMIRAPFVLMVVLKSKKRHDDTVNIYAMIHPK